MTRARVGAALGVVVAAGLALPGCGGDGMGSDAGGCTEPRQVQCFPTRGVIATEQLTAFGESEDVVLVDVRSEADFTAAHLPGAVRVDPGVLRAEVDGVPGQVAPVMQVGAVLEAAGLTPDVPVVVYGAGNTTDPARVLWTLAYHGHEGPLWLLDGGFERWSEEGREVARGTATPVASRYAIELDEDARVDMPWVRAHLEDPAVRLIDARSQAEYDAGHIPGARSVDWTRNLGDDGWFRPTDELRALYEEDATTRTSVVYCQTGSRAAVSWLVLVWLGFEDVRLYDGSWAEWGADPENPVER